eukprot:CAMPEP_0203714768 /NCGR_PEP_ID=MMETSP0091-20130426/71255_1 /ASSEMBLY_ACC=CAM_ASM_001089 /TAXON_ID=426623 /ORGANISM="Chaetoceros affinis, Strain CCMP159" /LENGTH=89 /DNA_ID=CAMNT_0050592849 /DNA_START=104 /DNA_END=373 /DNA_ORIENTATION=+
MAAAVAAVSLRKYSCSSVRKISSKRNDEDLKIEVKRKPLSNLNREELDGLMTKIKLSIYKEWERAKLRYQRKSGKIRSSILRNPNKNDT